MEHFPILAILSLFLGAFLSALFGKHKAARVIIVSLSIAAPMVLLCALIKPVMIDGGIITYWMGGWKPVADYAIGIGLEVDALSLFFALIVATAVLLSGVYSFKYMEYDDALDKYYTLFLLLSGGVMGLVMTGDLFNMYVMIEIMTFAAVSLTAFRTHVTGSMEASFKYLVVSSIGSVSVLVGTILIYSQLHTLNLAQIAASLYGNLTPTTVFAFALLIAGFACKAFMTPFHPIAADAHATAPSSISVMISGVLTKTGVYGIIRIAYDVFRLMDNSAIQLFLVVAGAISMFVCVSMALAQNDFKRLLAFHSISQIGYVMTAVGLSTSLGLTAGLYHAMNHMLFKGLLFLAAGAVLHETGTTKLDQLGGLSTRMPKTTALFLIGAASISGIPPFNGFVSKWLIYQALYERAAQTGNFVYVIVAVIAVVVSVMTLASFIKVGQSVFFGPVRDEHKNARETPLGMRVPMWIMAGLCFLTGVLPGAVTLFLTNPASEAALNVGKYIDVMMGAGYAERISGAIVHAPVIDYTTAGYWSPMAWLVLLFGALAAVTIVSLTTRRSRGAIRVASPDAPSERYDVFYGGEKDERSHVTSSDLFWGFKHNLRGYFGFMHEMHSGVTNDYALWGVSVTAIIIAFMFIFVKG